MGLTTTEAKTAALLNLPYPETLNKLEYFIGLTNWNRHLVPYYAQRIKPLTRLKTAMLKLAPNGRSRKTYTAKTKVPNDELLRSTFEDIRDAIGSRPKIFHFLHDRPVYVFLDASPEYGIGVGAYQQKDINKSAEIKTNLVPILFISRELTAAEKNYWPTDMEMSGLVWTVKKLRPYLEQTKAIFYTDHEPSASIYKMTGLATTSLGKSNLRLQNWGIYLSQFRDHISVVYRKGSEMEVPDALSRSRYQASEREIALKAKAAALGKIPDTDEFEITEAFHGEQESVATTLAASPDWHNAVQAAIQEDHYLAGVYKRLSKSTNEVDGYKIEPMTCQYALNTESNHLFYVDPKDDRLRAVLPTLQLQSQALALAHEGHQGYARTYEKLTKYFYWKKMGKDVKTYVDRCPQCLVNKPRNHRPYGHLQPIISPSIPFNTLTIDLVTDLPPCSHRNMGKPTGPVGEAFDSVMTVTDKFSKSVQFIEGRKDWPAKAWASKFYDRVITAWGYPTTLITDQDKRFMSKFWKEIFERAGTRCIATTPWHPQGDGQSERTNQSLEITLRFYADGRQNDWVHHLPTIQGIFNNSQSASTGLSPNEILYGMNLRCAVDLLFPESPFESRDAKEVAEFRDIIRKEAEDAIAISQKQMTKYHNTKHDEPDFSSGYAYISMRTGYTLPSIKKKKLTAQRMGPYRILETVGKGRALRLQLPPNAKISDVISITNLEPGPRPRDDPYERDLVNIREPIEGQGAAQNPAQAREVETLLDHRKYGRWKKPQYLVRWKGWTMEHDQWIDRANVPEEMAKEYEEGEARKT